LQLAHIYTGACRGNLAECAAAGDREAVCIDPVVRQAFARIAKIRMVRTVETFKPELQIGTLREFEIPLLMEGTEFQKRVWNRLRMIPYGQTTSYGELAKQIGDPKAVRAVGAANGQNPIPIIVPCHRVIGSNGSLTGFGGGLENKRKLLELERGQRALL